MKTRGGNKPLSQAGDLAFADMRDYIKAERIRLHSEFSTNEPRVVGVSHVLTPESRHLNNLLGLNTTKGLMQWYKH
jgi:hypothetical protein